MNLGLFLSPGDSLEKQQRSGQLNRFLKYYLQPYSKKFDQIYLFTYGDSGRNYSLPSNLTLVSKPKLIPNYLYQLILVFIHRKIIKTINFFRVFQAPGGLPAIIIKIFFHKPYIVTYGYDYVRFAQIENHLFLAQLLRLIIPLVLYFADKIIVTNQNNQIKLKKTVLIPNGVDPKVFKPNEKARKKYLVLSVGRLVRQKNYELLLKTISLSQFHHKIKLIIIGIGPLQRELLTLAEKLKVNLQIISNVDHNQLASWYQKVTVFALTSRIEGQSKVLLEAMSSGCVCLITPFIGNTVQDKVTGLIAHNSRKLAEKLDQLLSDSALGRQLGRQARQVIINKFDIKKLVAQEIKLLQSCSKK